jgi:hypothetical protein
MLLDGPDEPDPAMEGVQMIAKKLLYAATLLLTFASADAVSSKPKSRSF